MPERHQSWVRFSVPVFLLALCCNKGSADAGPCEVANFCQECPSSSGCTPDHLADASAEQESGINEPKETSSRDAAVSHRATERPEPVAYIPTEPEPTEVHVPCGDGELTEDEVCDDGNTLDGDGCQGNCLNVEPGYSCSPETATCMPYSKCGDGLVSNVEACDDGNTVDCDGCSANCLEEIGYACTGEPSICAPTDENPPVLACPDGGVDSGIALDAGCAPSCVEKETQSTAICGNGRLESGEECDDGDNDGGYGQCQPGCVMGAFCGNKIVEGQEHCDYGPGGGEACLGCRTLAFR